MKSSVNKIKISDQSKEEKEKEKLVKKPIPLKEKLTLSPIEKYRFYGKFRYESFIREISFKTFPSCFPFNFNYFASKNKF